MELHDRPASSDVQEPRDLPPADVFDPVIEVYKKDVDRTLLRENLRLTPSQRAEKLESFVQMLVELREARQRLDQHGS